MNRQIQQQLLLPNEMLGLPTRILRTTGSAFRTRYKEHIQTIRNNNSSSGYSTDILNTGYRYRTITGNIVIIRNRKRKNLNTLEKCHIYKISKDNPANE
jgi:hypothetical protein